VIELKTETGIEDLPLAEFERRVRAGLIPAETLVRLEVVTGASFKRLGDLELYQTLSDPDERHYARKVATTAPLMTAILVGLQVRVYGWSKVPGATDWLVDHLTNWAPAALEAGEVYRLLTYGFLHINFNHLALNMLFLAYAGWNLERAMGRRNLLMVYVGSVLVGGLLSMAMSPGRPSLGASGGDFGLIAASVVFGWKHEDRIPIFARKFFGWAILPYLVYPLCLGLLSSSVDNWGHLGGMLGGAALATWLGPEEFRTYQKPNRQRRIAVTVVCALVLAGVAGLGPRLILLSPTQERGLQAATPQGWSESWDFTEDRGWVSPLRQATFVVATKRVAHPQTADQAVAMLIDQIEARGAEVTVTRAEPVTLDGWDGQRVELAFDLGDESEVLHGLVVVRGNYVHRVQLHSPEHLAWRYGQVADKAFAEVHLIEPPDLAQARIKAESNPRSWKALSAYGREAGMAGLVDVAEDALTQAYQLAKPEHRAAIAADRLDLYADYGQGLEPEQLGHLIQEHGDVPEVVVAAAGALERSGDPAQAKALLDDAWAERPGEPLLRRARLARGLPVD
jgi:rhomboid protease GluP